MVNKKKSQKIHARKRASQRYGMNFGPIRLNRAIEQIRNNEVIILERSSSSKKVFLVELDEEFCPVVYDNKRKEIVTFLPREYLDRYLFKLENCIKI